MKVKFLHILWIILLVTACQEGKQKTEEIPLETFRGEVAATPVRVAKAERKSFDYLINASGKVEATEQVMVVIERAGYLLELNAREGELVEQGKILARLDDTEAKLKLEKAKIALKNAQSVYQSDLLSFETILNSGDQQRISQIEDQLKAKSGLFTAQIDLKEAELDLEKTIIKAPITGRIADLKIKRGSLVKSGDELLEIISPNRLVLKVKVLESDISLISIGQKSEIYPIGSAEMLSGTVQSINPKVDENGLVQVGILLSSSSKLLPGMNARAIIRAPQSNSLVVPKQALVYRSQRAVVFTVDKNESKWNYVEVGKDNGQEVEIVSGIEDGATVITTNNLQLAHQAPVQIVTE